MSATDVQAETQFAVISVGVISTTMVAIILGILFFLNPKVYYAWMYQVPKHKTPVASPFWYYYWIFVIAAIPFMTLFSVLFVLGDYWLGKTGQNSRVSAHVIMAITGLNTAVGLAFGFLHGHAGGPAAKRYANGKRNYVGIFTPLFVLLLWTTYFSGQGIMFYVYSTLESPVLRVYGQFLYWAEIIIIDTYLLVNLFWVAPVQAGARAPARGVENRKQQIHNMLSALLLGVTLWQTQLFGLVLARASEHSHLSETWLFNCAGMQAMEVAFVVFSVITSVAKQCAAAAVNPAEFGTGSWVEGPAETGQVTAPRQGGGAPVMN